MDKLKEISRQIDAQSQPPVHLWYPDHAGDIDIAIDVNGDWQHEGAPIQRAALVRLFSSILWFEGGEYFLITPAEKLRIRVADVPYVVQQVEAIEQNWVATLNTEEQVIVSADHPVQLRDYKGQWVPYLRVRYNLWARLSRTSYLTWVDAALEQSERAQLTSGDYLFDVAR